MVKLDETNRSLKWFNWSNVNRAITFKLHYVISLVYKSPHVTFKSGFTAVTNISTGLGIAEVIAEDSDSDTLTKTWQ